MEVAGLVLGVVGALPVIITVIEGYQVIVKSSRAERYMDTMSKNVRTEQVILRNTYQLLLHGIVPAWDLDDLQNMDPSTETWRKYDDQIRSRLRGSYQEFHIKVREIAEAVEELKEKLAITSSGEPPFTNWLAIVAELTSKVRVRAKFTLKSNDYNDTLSSIQKNNSLLRLLVDHSLEYEPTQRANTRAKFARNIRDMAQCLFSILCKVVCCGCADSHRLGLQLVQRRGEDRGSRDGRISFDMIFGTYLGPLRDNLIWKGLSLRWKEGEKDHFGHKGSTEVCRSIELLSSKDKDPPGKNQKPRPNTDRGAVLLGLGQSPTRPRPKHRKMVSFIMPTALQATREAPATKPPGENKTVGATSPPTIIDLCESIQRGELLEKQLLGFISCDGKSKGFDVYYDGGTPSSSGTASLTLREALSGKDGLAKFDLKERLHIALSLSFSILQLCGTPWLGKVISLDDILFLRAAGASRCYTRTMDFPAPFLVSQSGTAQHTGKSPRPFNFALLSLGVLLTHIITGHRVEDIDLNEDMTKESLMLRMKAANDEVAICDDASYNYVGAVQWCSKHGFTFATFDEEDQELSRNFHDAVVAKLESDLRSIDCLGVN